MPFDQQNFVVESETGKILRAAAQYIREHGWCQTNLYDSGNVCAIGGIAMARGIDLERMWAARDVNPAYHQLFDDQAVGALARYLKNVANEPSPYMKDHERVWYFNDMCGRTADEVIHALEEAAKLADRT